MDGVEDGRSAHGSKQFGTGVSGMVQVALRKAWFHGGQTETRWEVVMRASAAKSQRAGFPVSSSDPLRSSEAGSGGGFDVLPVYKDWRQLQKVNSGGGFVAETVQ